jgi:hypothetical protein
VNPIATKNAIASKNVHGRGAPRRFRPWRWNHSTARVERKRQEERDHDPRQDVPRDPDHLEYDGDGDDRPEQRQDRAQLEPDQALRDHGTIVAERSDVSSRTRGRVTSRA